MAKSTKKRGASQLAIDPKTKKTRVKKAGAKKADAKKASTKKASVKKTSAKMASVKETSTKKPGVDQAAAKKRALTGALVAVPQPAPGVGAEVLDRLWSVVMSRRSADPALSHSARLLSRGRSKVAQKFGEEAVECLIEAVNGDQPALVAESADVLYHLLVMWVSAGIRPEAVWQELARREGVSGITEKSRPPASGPDHDQDPLIRVSAKNASSSALNSDGPLEIGGMAGARAMRAEVTFGIMAAMASAAIGGITESSSLPIISTGHSIAPSS